MRLLLDTHALLWWLADDAQLGSQARGLLASGHTVPAEHRLLPRQAHDGPRALEHKQASKQGSSATDERGYTQMFRAAAGTVGKA